MGPVAGLPQLFPSHGLPVVGASDGRQHASFLHREPTGGEPALECELADQRVVKLRSVILQLGHGEARQAGVSRALSQRLALGHKGRGRLADVVRRGSKHGNGTHLLEIQGPLRPAALDRITEPVIEQERCDMSTVQHVLGER